MRRLVKMSDLADHLFFRYADDFIIMVKSLSAGTRVMASIRRFLENKLKLAVTEGSTLDEHYGTQSWTNPRTGEVTDIPSGIDPGWAYNPGKAGIEHAQGLLSEKLEGVPSGLADSALRNLVRSEEFGDFISAPHGIFPVMRLSEQIVDALGNRTRVAALSEETVRKNVAAHPELDLADYQKLPEIGAAPALAVRDGETTVVLVRDEADGWYWAAIKATESGESLFVTSLRRTNTADVKRLRKRGKVILDEK